MLFIIKQNIKNIVSFGIHNVLFLHVTCYTKCNKKDRSDWMVQPDLVCIGDSIVYGYGVHPRFSWPRVASERLGITILNRGINGDTSAGMSARFSEDVLWNHPKEVFIMAGANDILMGTSLERTCKNVSRMVERALESGIGTIVGIPITVDGEMLKRCWYSYYSIEQTLEIFSKYREWLIAYCETMHVPYIDFQKRYPEYLENAGIMYGYQDGVHPTKEGYLALANIFCEAYAKMKVL